MQREPASSIPLSDLIAQIDTRWMLENTERLWKIEQGATFRHWHRAAEWAEAMCREIGLDRVERIAHPADGRTVYLDRRMPLAWDVTHATLTVKTPVGTWDDPVIASYERHPFHVVKGSTGTPPEGVLVRLINEQQLFGGENTRGAMVVLEAETYPSEGIVRAMLDLGVIGFVVTNVTGQYETPDGISWPNAVTEGAHWHVQADDRPFLGFVVSPRVGDRLRAAVRRGGVTVHAVSDARRYEGVIHTVTGIVPGEDPREVWLMAHLYEPMPDDNSSGVVGAMEIVRLLSRLIEKGQMPKPRFTLRVVFTAEMYGFAAYAALRGTPLRDRVLGAINFDAVMREMPSQLFLAPPDSPFFGDYLLEEVLDEYHQLHLSPTVTLREEGWYADDQFLNDPTTGLATVWLIGAYNWWHNSQQTMARINPEVFTRHAAFYAAWLVRVLNLHAPQCGPTMEKAVQIAGRHMQQEESRVSEDFTQADEDGQRRIARQAPTWMRWRVERELARLRDFERVWTADPQLEAASERLRRRGDEAVESLGRHFANAMPSAKISSVTSEPIRDIWATGMVPRRLAAWQTHDQADIPKEKRVPLPGHVIYGMFGTILAHTDGRRNLKELVEYAEWVYHREAKPRDVRGFISAIEHLAAHGHLGLTRPPGINRNQIADALRAVGLSAGDLVLVHSKMSAFGHIEGGADTVIDAFLEVLGPRGTLFMPTFTQSAFYVNGQSWVDPAIRPFNAEKIEIWTGQVSAAFCSRGAAMGVTRSAHPTHSVAGCGPLAQTVLARHHEADPPTGPTSPFAALVEHRGKIIWFGADLGSCTFLHYLEDKMELPYLQPAVCRVERRDGRFDTVLVPKHLPGCRDFYKAPGEETKVFRLLLSRGLAIRQSHLGLGLIKAIDAVPLHDLGMEVLAEDPWVMLCDKPDCLFCRGYRPL